jgi:hypothetical protein
VAELILSDEEKITSWGNIDNESLGKIIKYMVFALAKKPIDQSENCERFSDDDEINYDMVTHGATIAFCCRLHDLKIQKDVITLENITAAGKLVGDWRVTFERIDIRPQCKNSFVRLRDSIFKIKDRLIK